MLEETARSTRGLARHVFVYGCPGVETGSGRSSGGRRVEARPIPVPSSFSRRVSGPYWRLGARDATGRPSKKADFGSTPAPP